jgi:hypothetical protein
MGSLLPRSRRASALRLGGPSARCRTPGNPLSLRVARPAASFKEGDAIGRRFLRQVRAGWRIRRASGGYTRLAEPGSLARLRCRPPRELRRRPGSGNSWGLHSRPHRRPPHVPNGPAKGSRCGRPGEVSASWIGTRKRARRERFRQGDCGNLGNMNKWRYALFGWVAWKVTKRYARRKLPL